MARHKTKSRARNAASATNQTVKETAQGRQMADMAQDAMAHTRAQLQEGAQAGLAAASPRFGVMGEQAFQAWMSSSNDTLRRVLQLNVELATWGREQLDDSIGAVRSLSQCRSFGDAYGVQLGLARSTMENSLRHANKVLSLTANVMAGAASAQAQGGQD